MHIYESINIELILQISLAERHVKIGTITLFQCFNQVECFAGPKGPFAPYFIHIFVNILLDHVPVFE